MFVEDEHEGAIEARLRRLRLESSVHSGDALLLKEHLRPSLSEVKIESDAE